MGIKLAVITAIDETQRKLLFPQLIAAQKMGCQVHSICTKGQYFQFLEDNQIIMYPVTIKRKISPLSDLITFWRIYRYLRREKIEIVHTHTPKCSFLGQLAARLAGVPIIVNTIHGFYFHENMKSLKKKFYILMEWIAAKCSTVIFSQNPEDIETAIDLGICKRDKIRFLGNGVDLSLFEPSRFDDNFKGEKRVEIGLPIDAVVVGIIGRLVREKGYIELFEAMKQVMAKHEKAWLVIVGPEEPEKSDRVPSDAFKRYGIGDRTIWLGPREDIPELLSSWDVYVLPSWREGFPRSAIEAAAMGLPIIATDIRGCRQVVEHKVTGLLVPLYNTNELAKAVEQLIVDSELRSKMGRAGYEKSRIEFDEHNVCQIITDTYRGLLADNLGIQKSE